MCDLEENYSLVYFKTLIRFTAFSFLHWCTSCSQKRGYFDFTPGMSIVYSWKSVIEIKVSKKMTNFLDENIWLIFVWTHSFDPKSVGLGTRRCQTFKHTEQYVDKKTVIGGWRLIIVLFFCCCWTNNTQTYCAQTVEHKSLDHIGSNRFCKGSKLVVTKLTTRQFR